MFSIYRNFPDAATWQLPVPQYLHAHVSFAKGDAGMCFPLNRFAVDAE
jgi:hypothetical protein